ncbi:MAG: hypothetical protein ETSY2_44580 [Candidatus Entotheonella gemina]|uniref:Uncharacterized protein n=1 Tax=Candidatus Entotheonella gemina TaxID=1429439 RepID=W4LJE8_9BACT|nr:MAG: hypothetical protein ETSY2_44580 [Candidatus Entotheonella gemina]
MFIDFNDLRLTISHFSLVNFSQTIAALLIDLNHKAFKTLPDSGQK